MKIDKQVFDEIISAVKEEPPEMGGILGKRGEAICSYEIDYGKEGTFKCSYSPNVDKLNNSIAKWQSEGIQFAGMFHTHFFGVSTLSPGDKEYIIKIMKSVSPYINELVFPIIVLPGKDIFSYKAIIFENRVEIISDIVDIVEIEGGRINNEEG